MDHSRSSASPVNGYHMSKQNPDVLDRLCSPTPDHLLHKKTLTPATVRVSGGGGGILIGTRNGHLPGQSSLVKQMLNDKHRAAASLVHLATRGKSFRPGVNISPVVVKLSGVAPSQGLPSNSSSTSNQGESGSPENSAEVKSRSSDGEGSAGKSRDPCDKNVVLSALRRRRYSCKFNSICYNWYITHLLLYMCTCKLHNMLIQSYMFVLSLQEALGYFGA